MKWHRNESSTGCARRHRFLRCITVSAALLLAACGQKSPESGSTSAEPTETTATGLDGADGAAPETQAAEEWLPRGINDIVWSSYIGLIGTVTSSKDVGVREPYMNYAQLTLRVERVLYTNDGWVDPVPKPGDELQFGQRRPSDGAIAGGLPPDLAPLDRHGPPLQVDTRVVIMLARGPIIIGPGESIDTLMSSHGYQSIWTIDAAHTAVSVQPSRTVALDDLLAKVQQEHERGRTTYADPEAFAEDQLTVDNPLGAAVTTTSPATSTTFVIATLPAVIESPTDLALTLDSKDGRVSVTLRDTEAGGIDIAVAVNGEGGTGVAAPTAASQQGKPLMVPLPSGEIAVVVIGAAGLSADGVRVLIDGRQTSPVSATWEREGSRPVVAVIAPKAPATVDIDGLIPDQTLTFDLIEPPEPGAMPPDSAPPDAGVTTTLGDEG